MRHRVRGWFLVVRIRIQARFTGSTVTVSISSDCRFRGPVRIRIDRGTTTSVRIGPRCQLGHGVVLVLGGGSLDVASAAIIRDGAVLHVRGRLVLEPEVLVSYYTVVHCDESVHIGARSTISEHVTISDSTHVPVSVDQWFFRHIDTAPVRLEGETWVAAKVTVTAGVTVGAGSILASGAVVTRDVPPDTTMAGVPARPIGPSPLRSLHP